MRPVHQVDNNLVECFIGFALNRLIKLCAQYRKGHRGESERKIIIGKNTFYVFKLTANHTLVMDNLSPVELRWIPEDLEDISDKSPAVRPLPSWLYNRRFDAPPDRSSPAGHIVLLWKSA